MNQKQARIIIGIGMVGMLACGMGLAHAAITGTIDPGNTGAHFAAFVHAPTAQSGSQEINFGKFTTATSDDITISGGSLHGYAWSPIAGWMVMNCANTISGCSSVNQDFAVTVSGTGVLSGYAWGQQTGWINFGPFLNNATPQVRIGSTGNFAGTTGTAGYAWSEQYGWIVFDCSNTTTCTSTDYTGSTSSGTLSGGGFPSSKTSPSSTAVTQPVSINTTVSSSPSSAAKSTGTSSNTGISSGPGMAYGTVSSGTLSPQPATRAPGTAPSHGPNNSFFSHSTPPQHNTRPSIVTTVIHSRYFRPGIIVAILILIAMIRFL